MAEPIIIVKENPGKLRVEVWDGDTMLGGHTFPDVPFSIANDELSAERPLFSEKFAKKRGGRYGDRIEIRIHRGG